MINSIVGKIFCQGRTLGIRPKALNRLEMIRILLKDDPFTRHIPHTCFLNTM